MNRNKRYIYIYIIALLLCLVMYTKKEKIQRLQLTNQHVEYDYVFFGRLTYIMTLNQSIVCYRYWQFYYFLYYYFIL
jgi:hypothetical protein